MLRVGLTGGLATGKSFVGRTLAELGCQLIQADALGHQLLAPEGKAFAPVVVEFGPGILVEGKIDRKILAREVFSKPERLARLNEIIHPLVFELEESIIRGIIDPQAIVVVEAAILIETGSYQKCDKLIVAVCEERQQIERAMARDGLTEEEVGARIARQMPLEEKKKYADYIIDTSGSREQTVEQVRRVYQSLRSLIA